MIKQIITLAIAASFGVAHAADVKPAMAEVKAAAAPMVATAKAEAPGKVMEAAKAEIKAPETKAATAAPAAAPEMKKEVAKPAEKQAKKSKSAAKPAATKAAPDAAKVEAPKAVEVVKK